ncbi:MAG TPA: hypothetical protein VFE10_10335 [Phenylobacterium sp.]|jgi:hypothetical protein|nr:hypothetical protein [Phenylobacterium sp.]
MDEASIIDRLRALEHGVDPDRPDWKEAILRTFEARYATGDHLAPWLALTYARGYGVAIPEWALDFFCMKATQINDVIAAPGGLSEAEAVGDALGFGAAGRGQRSLAHTNSLHARDRRLAMKVALRALEEGRGGNREATVALIAELESVSIRTVYRAMENCPGVDADVAKLLKPLDCQDPSIS